ncbi:Cytotoxic translational repressor of toxin-antitoxin stability system [Candidatus Magnetomoraceae bacterium gMMP-15]
MKSWNIHLTKKVQKQYLKLPEKVRQLLSLLIMDLENSGPVQGTWKNYGKLSSKRHHCHLKSGHPTYVACWEVKDKKIRLIEVYYVETHEKAPY